MARPSRLLRGQMHVARSGRLLGIGRMRRHGGSVAPLQAETTALLAAMTVQPSAARQTLINETIFSLKSAGIWAKLDFLHVLAAHDAQAARINWKTPANVVSVISTPTFTIDRGYVGDGVGAYLDTGLNPSTLTNYKQDDAHAGIWITGDAIGPGGSLGTIVGAKISINPHTAADQLSTRINNATANNTPITTAKGHSLINRSASAGYDVYKNAAVLGSPVVASTTIGSDTLVYLRNTVSYDGVREIAAGHGGASLTAAEITSLYQILGNYMGGVGLV